MQGHLPVGSAADWPVMVFPVKLCAVCMATLQEQIFDQFLELAGSKDVDAGKIKQLKSNQQILRNSSEPHQPAVGCSTGVKPLASALTDVGGVSTSTTSVAVRASGRVQPLKENASM